MTQEPTENPVPAQPADPQSPSQQGNQGSTFSEDSLRSSGREPSNKLSLSGWLSWLAIVAFTAFIVGNTAIQQFGEHENSTEATVNDLTQVNMQAKVIVGREELLASMPIAPPAKDKEIAEEAGEGNSDQSGNKNEDETDDALEAIALPPMDLTGLDTGSYEQRLCNVGIINEVKGPEEALEYLDKLDEKVAKHDFDRSENQLEMESSVRSLMENYRDGNLSADVLTEDQKQQLKDRLGFSGELLLNPPNSKTAGRARLVNQSQTTAIAMIVGVISAVLFFLFGIVALLFILTYVMTGSSPAQFIPQNNAHNAYVETFALWLFAFFGVQILVRHLELLTTNTQRLIAHPLFFFGSLIVLLWPILRGVPASKMLADIGWTPKKFFRNTFLSVPSYAAWLPAVLVGFFFVFVLSSFVPRSVTAGEFTVPVVPGHPAQEMLAGGDVLTWVTWVIAACIAAPIVEETMFRGVLYRHLRGLSMKYGNAYSIALSALVNGFIFASLHPQGILAVPLLTTVAIGFSLVREWRDSLWTSILMHAFNNLVATLVMFVMFYSP
ncbi:CPBP family intramembrane metalloprotease [bacterium]|nr:CPBP family intramembrane metalloprotease [bacterium]